MPAKHEAWPLGDKIGYGATATVLIGSILYGSCYLGWGVSTLLYYEIKDEIDSMTGTDWLWVYWGASGVALLAVIASMIRLESSTKYYVPFDKRNPNNEPEYHI